MDGRTESGRDSRGVENYCLELQRIWNCGGLWSSTSWRDTAHKRRLASHEFNRQEDFPKFYCGYHGFCKNLGRLHSGDLGCKRMFFKVFFNIHRSSARTWIIHVANIITCSRWNIQIKWMNTQTFLTSICASIYIRIKTSTPTNQPECSTSTRKRNDAVAIVTWCRPHPSTKVTVTTRGWCSAYIPAVIFLLSPSLTYAGLEDKIIKIAEKLYWATEVGSYPHELKITYPNPNRLVLPEKNSRYGCG